MALIGYARVSTAQQDTALQRAAFKRAGVKKVVEEKASGAKKRPALEAVLAALQPGDELVVYKLDRLARSLVDLLRIVAHVEQSGAGFRSLTEPIDTATPFGRMTLQLLGVIAEFERAVIRQRCMAGRAAAVECGVKFGRPPAALRSDVLPMVERGLSQVQIAAVLGVSAHSVRRAIRGMRCCDGGPGTHRRACA